MPQSKELALALKDVVAHRSSVVNLLSIPPDVFDSWLATAGTSKDLYEQQRSLRVIATWIDGLPDLRSTRAVLLRKCSGTAAGQSDMPALSEDKN